MDKINFLKENFKKVPDKTFYETIPNAILKLTQNQIETVSFLFWFCYMAEVELTTIITTAWKLSARSDEVNEMMKTILKDMGGDIDKLDYFTDKIKIYEAFFGKNPRTKILWKLKDLRNEIGHNRLDHLFYDNQDLHLRSIQEKLLVDYMESSLNQNLENSKFWNSLTPDEREKIEKEAEELVKKAEI